MSYSGKGVPELFTKEQDAAGEFIHRSNSALAEGPQGVPNSASYQVRGRGQLWKEEAAILRD